MDASLEDREGFAYWVEEIQKRVADQYDAVVVITGPRGSSKSTLALRLARAIKPRWSAKNLAYSPAALLECYERNHRGDVIVFDEGVRGFLSTDTFAPEQKALVQTLTLIREKGVVLIVCAPSIFLLAKQLRAGFAWFWVHVRDRGRGMAHVRVERLSYEPDSGLPLFRSKIAPWLLWRKFREDEPLWREYKAEKERQMALFIAQARATVAREEAKAGKPVFDPQRTRFVAPLSAALGPVGGKDRGWGSSPFVDAQGRQRPMTAVERVRRLRERRKVGFHLDTNPPNETKFHDGKQTSQSETARADTESKAEV